MADEKGNAEEFSAQNTAPFTADYEAMKSMTVPQTITVKSDRNMENSENRAAIQGKPMTVPEKIVLQGDSDSPRNVDLPGVNLDRYMGGMTTPPRKLTVDDATSRYMERKVDENDKKREEIDRLSHKLIEGSEAEVDSNLRLQNELVRLNKRIDWLEKKVEEKQSVGFWKTTFFCFLTVINPIIIHWLFNSRRH